MPGHSALASGGAERDLRLERTPPIVKYSYEELPAIGAEGELGVNRDPARPFFLSHQQNGDLFVRAGIIRGSNRLIRQGLEAFSYGFRHQRPDGSFGPIQTEEYAFFVQSVSHSLLLLEETRFGTRHRDELRDFRKGVRAAVPHMVAPDAWSAFKERNASYTHTAYSVGTALAMAAKVSGDEDLRRRLERRAGRAVELGLSRQREDGVNPELGGYDVRYQMAGLTYAQRWAVYFPKHPLTPAIRDMTRRGLKWMSSRVAPDGWIDWTGSTRACRETNTNGKPKTPGYGFAIRGFAYWGARTGRQDWRATANSLLDYLDTHRSACEEPAVMGSRSSGASGEAGSAGGFERTVVNDLFE